MAGADFIDDGCFVPVLRPAVTDDPVPQLRILPLKKARECRAGVFARGRIACVQPAAQHLVEFARAAAATPAQARKLGVQASHTQASFTHITHSTSDDSR